MDSLFEKITLYDFLGYAVPGCVCLLMLLAEWILTMPLETLEHLEAFGVGLGLTFLLLGYVLGVFLSQVSRSVFDPLADLWELLCKKIRPERAERNIVDEETLKSALRKSGLVCGEIKGNVPDDYMTLMYGVVQVDPDYKRIHNYSSAACMYKNMAAALMAGGAFWYISGYWDKSWICLCFLIAVFYWVRWRRFEKKKNDYAMVWFIEKYNS